MKTLLVLAATLGTLTSVAATELKMENYAFAKAETSSLPITSPKPDTNTIKVALLLDTSNSMDGLIDQARAQLWELVNELALAKCGNDTRPDLKIALYEYGNDRLNAREGYIRMVSAFSTDLDEISKNLFSLTTNGGNEYCGNVIQTSLNQLDWGKKANDLNLIFIAGNEPFNQGPVAYQSAASNACGKDVTINTIFCGDYNQGVQTHWKDGASLTKGDYIAINSDRTTVHIPSPYDEEILHKNAALNKKAYGSANAVKRAVSKSSRLYKNSSWDLVDALDDNEEIVEELEVSELPKELKGKTDNEIKEFIQQKKKAREKIQKEIAELNSKRKSYVASKTNEKDNELRNALIEAIKKQGKVKDYHWEE